MNKKSLFIRNFVVGFLSQIIILILGFVVPRIVLVSYGSDTNGLLNTITQVFMYMALLESGVSQAATNALYRPFKNNDDDGVSFVASMAKKQYKKISLVYAFAVLAMSFILPLLIKTSINFWVVCAIILFEGATNVLSFYFINTWSCVLNACGKNYINSSFNLIMRISCYAIKIVLSLYQVNIAIIQVGYFSVSVVKLVLYYFYFKKHFPWLNLKVDVRNEKLPYKNQYLITEIASVIFQSTDMIVLSIFVSTSASSVYSIYNLVFVSLSTLLNGVYTSLVYLLNQTYISDIEKYKKTHDVFNSFFVGSMTVLMCVSYFLITPFVSLYTSGVHDINYINKWYPLLFCLIPLISWCRYPQTNLAGISGNAKKMAICSIVEAVVNLSLSIVFVRFFDIIGVLLATLIALPIKVIYLNYLSEKEILKRKPTKTILILVSNILVFVFTVLLSEFFVDFSINTIYDFIKYGFALSMIYAALVFSINSFINKDLLLFISKLFSKEKGEI